MPVEQLPEREDDRNSEVRTVNHRIALLILCDYTQCAFITSRSRCWGASGPAEELRVSRISINGTALPSSRNRACLSYVVSSSEVDKKKGMVATLLTGPRSMLVSFAWLVGQVKLQKRFGRTFPKLGVHARSRPTSTFWISIVPPKEK